MRSTGAGAELNDSRSRNTHDDDDESLGGPAMLGGYERQRLLAVGCGSLAAGASLVALVTFATDRCHVCVHRRRRRCSVLSAGAASSSSACRRPRFAKPEPEIVVASPPSLSSPPADENQVGLPKSRVILLL